MYVKYDFQKVEIAMKHIKLKRYNQKLFGVLTVCDRILVEIEFVWL